MGLGCGWRHARKKWSWEFEDFEKSQLKWDHGGRELSLGHWGMELIFLPLRRLSFSDSDRRRWIEFLNTTRCAACRDGVSIVRIVSLTSYRHERKSGINKCFRTWNNRVHMYYICVCLYNCICICTVVIDIIMAAVYNINTTKNPKQNPTLRFKLTETNWWQKTRYSG